MAFFMFSVIDLVCVDLWILYPAYCVVVCIRVSLFLGVYFFFIFCPLSVSLSSRFSYFFFLWIVFVLLLSVHILPYVCIDFLLFCAIVLFSTRCVYFFFFFVSFARLFVILSHLNAESSLDRRSMAQIKLVNSLQLLVRRQLVWMLHFKYFTPIIVHCLVDPFALRYAEMKIIKWPTF